MKAARWRYQQDPGSNQNREREKDADHGSQDTKNALQIFLKSIPLGASFNIVSFGSYYHSLFDHCVPYNNDTLAKAVAVRTPPSDLTL
jgi:hypothetical protein